MSNIIKTKCDKCGREQNFELRKGVLTRHHRKHCVACYKGFNILKGLIG